MTLQVQSRTKENFRRIVPDLTWMKIESEAVDALRIHLQKKSIRTMAIKNDSVLVETKPGQAPIDTVV